MMNSRTLLLAALALAPATASPAAELQSKTVSLAGVRFDDPSSMADLQRRLARAARAVCWDAGTRFDAGTHRCRKAALLRAHQDLRRIRAAASIRLAGASARD